VRINESGDEKDFDHTHQVLADLYLIKYGSSM